MTSVDAPAVDAVIGDWLAEQARRAARAHRPGRPSDGTGRGLRAVAANGETLRGAVDTDGAQVQLMAAAAHGDQLVPVQVEGGAKTNEKRQR